MEEEEAVLDTQPEMALWSTEVARMSPQKPPIRPGIAFEIGARLEAQDYLQKWYTSKIEKIDYEAGKVLIHFERWSSRYDEWIHWDSTRIRPLEKPALRKEGLKEEEEEENYDFKEGDEVLARWTDCRYYPAKIETINTEGTYTVQFYDGVIRCLKKMHIKYMPEDAKGQDWIALVKAAAAAGAVKSKSGNKPRTSANSNKDKEERKLSKGLAKKEEPFTCKPIDFIQKEEEKPTSSRTLDVPKIPLQQREDELLLKRKISQASLFQAKRARLNKITGLLASKAVELDDAEKKEHAAEMTSRLEEEISPKPQSQKQNEAGVCHDGITLKPSLIPTALSPSGKARTKKDRREPGDVSGCKKSPVPLISPDLTQGVTQPTNLSRSSGHNNRRRRSGRLSTPVAETPCPSVSDGKGMTSYPQTSQDLSVAKVPDVAYIPPEKPEPLDLRRSVEHTTPLVPESSSLIDSPHKEKENIQITYSSKAVADGRIASTSSAPLAPVHVPPVEMTSTNNLKISKGGKKKRPSVSISSEVTETVIPPIGIDKLSENLQEKIIKKVNEKDKHSEVGVIKSEKKIKEEEKISLGKKKEKDKDKKDKKEKDHIKSKQKKKKKKKKKAKSQECSDYEDNSLDILERCSSPLTHSSCSTLSLRNPLPIKNTSSLFPRAILSVDLTGENLSDMDLLDDSSTESLILSGDEYNQEFDSTNFEESQDEEDAINEIVRCICEMDEENGFMIQCEECLCWQHSVCMGLLEDSIPEQYICYVCNNPPGQRWSAKYKYDKDWFNNGRLCGLSFINENYSYINSKKIVSTHHLLADVYGVAEILHGLQLKIGILKNKEHPDLRFWACPGTNRDEGHQVNDRRILASCEAVNSCGENRKGLPNALRKSGDTYIASEHSYQKPQGSGQALKSSNNAANSDNKDGLHLETEKCEFHLDAQRSLQVPPRNEHGNEQNSIGENTVQTCHEKRGTEDQLESHLQWQLNLLAHIENVQNEVTSRMDLIEKEVDVLESWLDFTGELEPPDPLARLPQLKKRIKQLLTDMNKVQQIATLCSV
ncbi:PHD finger protein 20-like protein 1 [Pelobates fuscus]|uniref:PHD finger protein 20-like protein 1 n=1 Tax=Pelobates fuscus TaxID=191477 RepID=UPI002FE4BB18